MRGCQRTGPSTHGCAGWPCLYLVTGALWNGGDRDDRDGGRAAAQRAPEGDVAEGEDAAVLRDIRYPPPDRLPTIPVTGLFSGAWPIEP